MSWISRGAQQLHFFWLWCELWDEESRTFKFFLNRDFCTLIFTLVNVYGTHPAQLRNLRCAHLHIQEEDIFGLSWVHEWYRNDTIVSKKKTKQTNVYLFAFSVQWEATRNNQIRRLLDRQTDSLTFIHHVPHLYLHHIISSLGNKQR